MDKPNINVMSPINILPIVKFGRVYSCTLKKMNFACNESSFGNTGILIE